MRNFSNITFFLLLLCSCSGDGSPSTPSVNPANERGTLSVIIDTRSGDDAWVQFQLAGAMLEYPGGLRTENLLKEARILTVGDPSGESIGFDLGVAPTAEYSALHLIFTPGTGIVREASGVTRSVTGPTDVRVPIADGLLHERSSVTWLVIGHDAAPLDLQGTVSAWNPQMSARPDQAEVSLGGLAYPQVQATELLATATTVENSVISIDESGQCIYRDEDGTQLPSQSTFYGAVTVQDDLSVRGYLSRRGHLDAIELSRKPSYDEPRLIGRILSIDENNRRFEMRVQAVNQRGSGILLEAMRDVWIDALNARIEAPNNENLIFSILSLDQLVKIKWSSVSLGSTNGLDTYQATDVVVPGPNSNQYQAQWQGVVASIDLVTSTLVIEPRQSNPIRVNGQIVSQATVQVDSGTTLERRPSSINGSREVITLSDIIPGSDRTWVSGIPTGTATIQATRVRVRDE
jgi:hypothetical protein